MMYAEANNLNKGFPILVISAKASTTSQCPETKLRYTLSSLVVKRVDFNQRVGWNFQSITSKLAGRAVERSENPRRLVLSTGW